MRRLLFLCCAILLAACAQRPRAIPTPTRTAVVIPPTWTLTPARNATNGPSPTPAPTRTIGPVATPAAAVAYTVPDNAFSLQIPANWSKQSGQRQFLNAQQQRQMNYLAAGAPGPAPQPALLIFYKWPNAGPISNDNAWEQAFAVASLAAKVCPMTLTTGDAITIGGETGKYIGYEDGCGVQGELIGFVHGGVNYGVLIEAPESLWTEWRPILRNIVSTIEFK